MWASGHNGDIRRAAHGYEETREAAKAAFAKAGGGNSLRASRGTTATATWLAHLQLHQRPANGVIDVAVTGNPRANDSNY
jgi:hypothetical protein